MDRQNNRNNAGPESTRELLARLDALLEEDWQVGMDLNTPEPSREETLTVSTDDNGKAKEKVGLTKVWMGIIL